MKTIFFGTSSHCLPIVESLYTSTELVATITLPDAKVGRTQEITPSPIAKFSQSHKIPCYKPATKQELEELFSINSSLNADIFIVADYGLMIPKSVFEKAKHKTLNIHFGKLPKYRGASPVQWMIANGETSIPITIFLLAEGLDTGPIVWEKEVEIGTQATASEVFKTLFEIAAKELPAVLENYSKGNLKPTPQKKEEFLVTKRLTRNDGFIPWEILNLSSLRRQGSIQNDHPPAMDSRLRGNDIDKQTFSPILQSSLTNCQIVQLSIFNLYRALTPWPGIWTVFNKKRLKILSMNLQPTTNNLQLISVQLEGKTAVPWEQFQSAYLK